MRKLLIILAAVALLVPAFAWAGDPSPWPPLGSEVEVYREVGGLWTSLGVGDPAARARAFTKPALTADSCNKAEWLLNVENHASIAQWLVWSTTGLRWDWFVRKPGCYAADCITFTLKSNCDVNIGFSGFADLLRNSAQGGGEGVTQTIPVWYAQWDLGTPPPPTDPAWIRAADLNNATVTIKDSEQLHQGHIYKLWNKICVQESNSCCEYEDDAVVHIKLSLIKIWIDPETGNFKPI